MPELKGYDVVTAQDTPVKDTLKRLQVLIRMWANTTEISRLRFKRDYEMVEGNGKQWKAADRIRVEKRGMPALEFNQIQPQVELACGIQRGMELDFDAVPRGLEDRRLGEIASASLKAASDFGRIHRVTDKVFDDGITCGLGVWEVLHTLEDPDDLVWGDVVVNRINPMAFIYDPWATQPDWQDGELMGKATWFSIQAFKERYPKHANLATPGDWATRLGPYLGATDDLGVGPNLAKELYDSETGRIRVLSLWHKVPAEISLIIDTETGSVIEVKSKDEGEQMLADYARATSGKSVGKFSITTSGTTSAIVDANGQIALDPRNNQPLQFGNREAANARLTELADLTHVDLLEQFKVVTRQAKVPHFAEMVWWEIINEGKTPYTDRYFPYVVYVSRQFSDDPEAIEGIVRPLHDPQEEYNKRYSNLLAISNSSAHSGWINRKSGGANRSELEGMGSKPGVVVEYATVAPQQIRPVELSQGHFNMIQHSERAIMRISGINAEMVGQTTQATVSGRAIRARQEGGSTILKPRFKSFEEAQIDLSRLVLSRIKQFYPVEKIKRILGVAETQRPLGPKGQSIFINPVTGKPSTDDELIELLTRMKNTNYDLVLRLSPETATERQAQFEQAVQLAGLITSTGRPIGQNTMAAMIDLANLPTRVVEGLKQDAEQAVSQQMAETVAKPGGQNAAVQGLIGQLRGGRAGGHEGVIGGT